MGNRIKTTSTNQANKKALTARCGVNDTLSLIGQRWLMTTLYEISLGKNQFSVLRKTIPDISEQVLATRIHSLETQGLITKTARENTTPLQVIYAVTVKGAELLRLVAGLCQWDINWKTSAN